MNRPNPQTARTRERWDRMAPKYDRMMSWNERMLFGDGRAWVYSRVHGDVLEIAVGTGRNLAFYPEDAQLTGIELSPEMLGLAKVAARKLGHHIELQEGDAQDLPFSDDSFDAVVCTLSLCSIPDDGQAVREVWRVLKPGGRFLLLEQVASPNPLVRAGQWLLDFVTVRFQGDHQLREPLVHLRATGFEIETLERRKLGIVERLVARKPLVDA